MQRQKKCKNDNFITFMKYEPFREQKILRLEQIMVQNLNYFSLNITDSDMF